MNYRNVSTRGVDNATKAANLNPEGVSKLTFHDLRHTYGSHLAQSGLDPVGVQRQMGHARPSITMDLTSTSSRPLAVASRSASILSPRWAGSFGLKSDQI